VEADIGVLKDEMVLEEVALPTEDVWKKACERAKAIFGIPASPLLNAANLASLADHIAEKANAHSADITAVAARLAAVKSGIFPEMNDCARLDTLREAQALLKSLSSTSGNDVVKRLAEADLKSNLSALGASISNAGTVDRALESTEWKILQGIRALTDNRKEEADRIWGDLEIALKSDEYAVALGPKIAALKSKAVDLLTKHVVLPPPQRAPEPPAPLEPPLPPKTVAELKELYGQSQADGDDLPDWVEPETVRDVLKIHFFGDSKDVVDWKSMIVVSPTLKALIDLDSGARIDLKKATLKLPRFGQTIKLTVKPQHLE
jgi:hypothetical protein